MLSLGGSRWRATVRSNLLNLAIVIGQRRKLTPIQLFLQAEVSVRSNLVSNTEVLQFFTHRLDSLQSKCTKTFQGVGARFPQAAALFEGEAVPEILRLGPILSRDASQGRLGQRG